MRRRAFVLVTICSLALAMLPPGSPAAADSGIYYFHGNPTDNTDKAAVLVDNVSVSGATFSTTPPTGAAPIVQTTTPVANEDFVGNPLTAYWHGHFTGAVSGKLKLHWWWTVPAVSGTPVSITVFADPDYAADRGQASKVIGRGQATLNGAAAPTAMDSEIFVSGTIANELLIQVAATSVVSGNGIAVYYDSTTTPSSFQFVDAPLPTTPSVSFDTTTGLVFAPSTTVSAHFLGGEPQTTLERRVSGSKPGAIDPNRVFVDWPLSSRSGIGQLSRSIDGGDTFRLLYDPSCAPRSRPNCASHGGGDTENDVNLMTGDLFFGDQEVVVQEALASSTDHGDTFPLDRQFAVTNAGSAVDRQWLAWSDPSFLSIGGKKIEEFYSYHVPAAAVHVIAVTVDGTPIPQPVPQIVEVSQSGNLRVDDTNGPARGWMYVPYRKGGGYFVASARVADYALPSGWQSFNITSDTPAVFPWLNLDAHGNLYAVWVTGGIVYLSMSPIDDPQNDPSRGGRPARFWTPKVRVSLPAVTSAVFPAVTGGDAGRIAITYMGSEDCTPGVSDNCANEATWNTYAAVITDALSLARPGATTNIVSGKVNHRTVHRGQVCTSGTTCTGDRSLLDMIDLGYDESGRVAVVFMDNNNGLAAEPRTTRTKDGPFTEFAKLVSGPSLLAPTGTAPATIAVSIPENGRSDASGDATWPNVAGATNLPALDLLGASVFTDGTDLVVRMPVGATSRAALADALARYNAVRQTSAPADRLQYVFRFHTAEDVWHLSMEYSSNDQIRFFGGKLDANDGLSNGSSTLGAAYHTDVAITVTGTVDAGVITLRAPLASFGLVAGSRITGANAYAMAGPAETLEQTILTPMRTVDATPPFDATLTPGTLPPRQIECDDENVQTTGGWHTISDSRATGGRYCRNVGHDQKDAMTFTFVGNGLDVAVAKGPRGGKLVITVDGVPQTVDLYRAPANPSKPDNSGRKDLDFNITIHRDTAPGAHTVAISNGSTDPQRDMVYVDGFTIYGGDISTPQGSTVHEVLATVLGTAIAGSQKIFNVVLDPAAEAMEFVFEVAAGSTVSVVDPSGRTLATATVDGGGVVDVEALPSGAGTYALMLTTPLAGDMAFELWEVIAEKR